MNYKWTLVFSLALVLPNAIFAQTHAKVIYGKDNRKDIYEIHDNKILDLARSTAAMIRNGVASENEDGYRVNGRNLQDQGFCSKEKFSTQLTVAMCSGFLVAPDILVTAGHCIRNIKDCEKHIWVFDFSITNEEDKGLISRNFPKKNVFKCQKILDRKLSNLSKMDYAIIKLDRPVQDRTPLSFRQTGKVEKNDNVFVIGHPSGLPTKVADGAWVRKNSKKNYFKANLDAFGGNSGSAVFSESGIVEGILVRGAKDYVVENGCKVAKKM